MSAELERFECACDGEEWGGPGRVAEVGVSDGEVFESWDGEEVWEGCCFG